ncbi:uncharacterized protein SCDLUD_005142 [Saccharomycodes ludwigii]|uniref:uncharacterized protein n=1 Tax=Saccharomycodes ludwigii TaxID=36035 RepID=UPI001E82332E|nr:hypothetical protein SCDLUD_005142 [Saccharomycodes ludwigii]KAH3898804.1 hypothetical protein SCDLUD_005142 [Saccharomycodes ludwigii]
MMPDTLFSKTVFPILKRLVTNDIKNEDTDNDEYLLDKVTYAGTIDYDTPQCQIVNELKGLFPQMNNNIGDENLTRKSPKHLEFFLGGIPRCKHDIGDLHFITVSEDTWSAMLNRNQCQLNLLGFPLETQKPARKPNMSKKNFVELFENYVFGNDSDSIGLYTFIQYNLKSKQSITKMAIINWIQVDPQYYRYRKIRFPKGDDIIEDYIYKFNLIKEETNFLNYANVGDSNTRRKHFLKSLKMGIKLKSYEFKGYIKLRELQQQEHLSARLATNMKRQSLDPYNFVIITLINTDFPDIKIKENENENVDTKILNYKNENTTSNIPSFKKHSQLEIQTPYTEITPDTGYSTFRKQKQHLQHQLHQYNNKNSDPNNGSVKDIAKIKNNPKSLMKNPYMNFSEYNPKAHNEHLRNLYCHFDNSTEKQLKQSQTAKPNVLQDRLKKVRIEPNFVINKTQCDNYSEQKESFTVFDTLRSYVSLSSKNLEFNTTHASEHEQSFDLHSKNASRIISTASSEFTNQHEDERNDAASITESVYSYESTSSSTYSAKINTTFGSFVHRIKNLNKLSHFLEKQDSKNDFRKLEPKNISQTDSTSFNDIETAKSSTSSIGYFEKFYKEVIKTE